MRIRRPDNTVYTVERPNNPSTRSRPSSARRVHSSWGTTSYDRARFVGNRPLC